MPRFAFTAAGHVVESSPTLNDADFSCCKCGQPLALVRSSNRCQPYFKHKEQNEKCSDSMPTKMVEIDDSPVATTHAMAPWRAAWQKAGENMHPHRREVRGIGDDCQRPRDLGDTHTNAMIEIQHSPMSTEEYDRRNAGVHNATWIFDATTETLWNYDFAEESIWFCSDRFRARYMTNGKCHILFHCADGKLYQAACDDAITIEIYGRRRCIRMLKPINADVCGAMDTFFGDAWPLTHWDGAPEFRAALPIESPIRVLGEAGRREIDAHHRAFMYRFPTAPRTVVFAPPGAGKTTAIIEMIRRWQRRALVITFNKPTQQTMQQRLKEAGLTMAHARTIDSLCFEACSGPSLMNWSDGALCHMFWEKSAHTKFGRNGGGRRSSNIVDFRFRHPRAAHQICKKHQRLGVKECAWDAEFSTYPMSCILRGEHKEEGCATFASLRYRCDQDRLLASKLNAYDIILVDEMQDLISAQEQRLLFQTCKPIVLVGDPMQAINAFRDDPPCTECLLKQEDAPPVPPAIEWYGTWRLDGFTVRFVEERFGRRMCSYRAGDETAEVYWKDELVYDSTLLLCRYNKHAIEAAMRFIDMRVVSGDTMASRLVAASKDASMLTPMAKYAQQLGAKGQLDVVCDMLRKRSIRLADVKDVAAVTTVHQAKGFEFDHCAVHSDLLSPESEEERNISFVAFTRHTKSLVVMYPMVPSRQSTETRPRGTVSKYFN